MDRGSNNHFSISHTSSTSSALWNATIDTNSISEQAKAWAASRSNFGINCDQNMDPKKMKQFMLRSLANKRSRLRKKMYLANLEIKAKEIQVQIDHDLRSQIESELDKKCSLLLERERIIHEINILEKELLLKNTLTKELLAELNVWKELYTMNSNNKVPPISYELFQNYCSNPFDQALTGESLTGLNVSNELHTMQQEQQAQMLDSNNYNVPQISYDPFPNYFPIPYDQDIKSNESQMWEATIANEHETNLHDV